MHDKIKVPIYVQAGIHGNESEGIDASLQIIERLATTPYGTDPEVDTILDNAVVLFNVIQNPDGHIAEPAGQREQLRPEPGLPDPVAVRDEGLGRSMQKWLSAGGARPARLRDADADRGDDEAAQPGIEYDLWLKWNQTRIDANEAAMNAIGLAVTRPVNDWCPNGSPAARLDGALRGRDPARPCRRRGLGRLGPVLHADVRAAHRPQRLDGRDVQLHRHARCGVPGSTTHPRGRVGSRTAQYTVVVVDAPS